MQLAIYKLEDSTKPLCTLSEGEHLLGRGPQLDCTDKRISRNHISIVVNGSSATFSLVHHTNPCYWKCAESKHITLLKPNCPVDINNGDTFGFLPDVYWFRIKHCEPGENNNVDVTSTTNVEPETIANSTLEHKNEETSDLPDDLANENKEHDDNEATEMTETKNSAVKTEVVSTTSEQNKRASVSCPDMQASCSTSQTKVFKDRCWYGANCYRKNSEHRDEYSHPGDADYNTDPEDDRPACPYGRNCYRKNQDHRKNCKHSNHAKTTKRAADDNEDEEDAGRVNPANIIPNKRKRKPRQSKKKANGNENNGEDDEYESDFIDDDPFDTDDDDDFAITDSDSDYEY